MPSSLPSFFELFEKTQRSAVHLEMRDVYAVASEAADFKRWQETGEANTDPHSDYWRAWVESVRSAVQRGVSFRRARIVSEPVTHYIRFEHALTAVNLYSGEEIRWLPRRQASRIALPGNDFWCLDGKYVRLNHFTGDGDGAAEPFEDSEDPALAELCSSAFEAVWEIATPHDQFTV